MKTKLADIIYMVVEAKKETTRSLLENEKMSDIAIQILDDAAELFMLHEDYDESEVSEEMKKHVTELIADSRS